MTDYPTASQPIIAEPERPCAFVNTSSGERAAAIFVSEQLKKHFGADSVFDLFPVKGQPPVIAEAKAFIVRHQPDLLVVAGGDGTVSLGLDIVDELRAAKEINSLVAPIAVIPMGTGNDLSRSMGFGGGYKKALKKPEEHFTRVLRRLYMARPCNIDRFTLAIEVVDRTTMTAVPGEAGTRSRSGGDAIGGHTRQMNSADGGTAAAAAGAAATLSSPESMKEKRSFEDGDGHHPYQDQERVDEMKQRPAPPPAPSPSSSPAKRLFTKVFTNYFSIGFDADVAKQFGDFRDNNPAMCKSRVANKMWYGCFGCNAMCCSSALPRKGVSLTVNGHPVKVPSGTKSVVVSNMITYAGGNVLWTDRRHHYAKPAVDDGKAEIIALEGVWHMVGVGTQTRSGMKLGQGSSVVLYAPADFTMQYDGEPIAAMGTSRETVRIEIQFKSQSLGMRVPKENMYGDGPVQPLHNEEEG